MLTKNDIRQLLEKIAGEEGVELFDLDYPANNAGVLRVYISKSPGVGAVGLDDCSRVSRRIADTEQMDQFLGGSCTLEVSSPGINRRLSRPEHFERAVGERIKVTYLDPDKGKRSITGTLTGIDDAALAVMEERMGEAVHIALANIESARVDFLFNSIER